MREQVHFRHMARSGNATRALFTRHLPTCTWVVSKSPTLLAALVRPMSRLQLRVSHPTPVPILFTRPPMPILVVPVPSCYIPSYAVNPLRLLHDVHVDIDEAHAFLGALFGGVAQRADKRQGHARQSHVVFIGGAVGRTGGVDEDDGAGIFERAQGQGRGDEETLGARVESQAGVAAVAHGPCKRKKKVWGSVFSRIYIYISDTCVWGGGRRTEGGDDNHFGAGGDQFPECLGEGEIPADEQADGAERGLDDGVRVVSAGG